MTLWDPITVGRMQLPHRLAMAPMTRDRSRPDGVPTELNVEYYRQRASMALIVTEGTQPSADGQGYLLTPGIHTVAHVAGWREVTDAVHAEGGRIVAQLMHTGRVAHPDNTPHGRQPVAPSAVRPTGVMFTASGPQEMPTPRALGADEVAGVVEEFRHAASAAVAAGFDAVEVHGANGYLVHQFLSDNANQRTDAHGGSIANRIRFAVDVVSAVADEIGADRTGLRISPSNPYNDIVEADPHTLYSALLSALAPMDLAYLHLLHFGDEDLLRDLRRAWPTALLLNRAGTDIDTRVADLDAGLADVITVGALALANPDLPARVRAGAPLNDADPTTFYGGDHRGYTDYPTLEEVTSRAR
ncbi:alkene reductase [Modestobacter sp. VKM Ac-2978]|uniref:alkene reductase n=1 Tax=Modestobacter sp. VKM Ac-2978 TaxID=3004132 RepID=UPI0022AA3454|nr:alkene reductase [Modestobacter sp. VKM Ac-2978]MCZ2850523.1 alkene reductase [Modestobacter sp. VKM Ac-2978]